VHPGCQFEDILDTGVVDDKASLDSSKINYAKAIGVELSNFKPLRQFGKKKKKKRLVKEKPKDEAAQIMREINDLEEGKSLL